MSAVHFSPFLLRATAKSCEAEVEGGDESVRRKGLKFETMRPDKSVDEKRQRQEENKGRGKTI